MIGKAMADNGKSMTSSKRLQKTLEKVMTNYEIAMKLKCEVPLVKTLRIKYEQQ